MQKDEMVQAAVDPAANDGAVTLSLVERLTSARKGARTEEDARAIADAQDVIERLTSQGGAPDVTDDMAEAGRDWAQREWCASGDPKGYLDFYRGIYRAMLSAAPQPPASQLHRAYSGDLSHSGVQPPEGGTEEFEPNWSLSANEATQVALTLALTRHVPGWPGATDEQLEAVAREVLAALPRKDVEGQLKLSDYERGRLEGRTTVDLIYANRIAGLEAAISAERASVIEECAKVADVHASTDVVGWSDGANAVRRIKAGEIAAAIRDLGKQTGGENG